MLGQKPEFPGKPTEAEPQAPQPGLLQDTEGNTLTSAQLRLRVPNPTYLYQNSPTFPGTDVPG